MITATVFAVLFLAQQPAGQSPADEVDPVDAAEAEAEARERRAFAGPGATGLQTLGVRAPEPPEPGRLYEPPRVRPYEMPESLAAGLSPWSPRAEPPSEAVTVDAYLRSYEGPPDPLDLRFQAGMQGALAAVEAQSGPLDGAWILAEADGRPLYRLVLADPAPGGGVEGAWLALTGPEGARASGVLGTAAREGDGLTASFVLPDRREPVRLRLGPGPEGWRGVMTTPGGEDRAVVLRPA